MSDNEFGFKTENRGTYTPSKQSPWWDDMSAERWQTAQFLQHVTMVKQMSNAAAQAAHTMWTMAATSFTTAAGNLRAYGTQLEADWDSAAGDAFLAQVGGALYSFDKWAEAATENAAAMTRVDSAITTAQTAIAALYESYNANSLLIGKGGDLSDQSGYDESIDVGDDNENMLALIQQWTEKSRPIMQELSSALGAETLTGAGGWQGPMDVRVPTDAEIQAAVQQAAGAGGAGAPPGGPGGAPPGAPGAPGAPPAAPPGAPTGPPPARPGLQATLVPSGSRPPPARPPGLAPTAPPPPPALTAAQRAALVANRGAPPAAPGGLSAANLGAAGTRPEAPQAPTGARPAAPGALGASALSGARPAAPGGLPGNALGAPPSRPPGGPGGGPGLGAKPGPPPSSPAMRGLQGRNAPGMPGQPGMGRPGRPPGSGATPQLGGRSAPGGLRPPGSAGRPGNTPTERPAVPGRTGAPPPTRPGGAKSTENAMPRSLRGARAGEGPAGTRPGAPGSVGGPRPGSAPTPGLNGRAGTGRRGAGETPSTREAALRRGLDGRGAPVKGGTGTDPGARTGKPGQPGGSGPGAKGGAQRRRDEETATLAQVGDAELFDIEAAPAAVVERPKEKRKRALRAGPALGKGKG